MESITYYDFRQAINDYNIEKVKVLIQNGIDTNMVDENGDTFLHVAASSACGRRKIINLLLDQEGSSSIINAINKYENTALHIAALHSNTQIIKLLIEKGADVTRCGKNGLTALHIASDKACVDGVKLLLKHGSNVNAIFNNEGNAETPLETLILSSINSKNQSYHDVITLLVKAGASLPYYNLKFPTSSTDTREVKELKYIPSVKIAEELKRIHGNLSKVVDGNNTVIEKLDLPSSLQTYITSETQKHIIAILQKYTPYCAKPSKLIDGDDTAIKNKKLDSPSSLQTYITSATQENISDVLQDSTQYCAK